MFSTKSQPYWLQVRRWDVESGASVDTLTASKAVYCVAAPPEGSGAGLLAFGGAERVLRLWDPRTAPGEALVRPVLWRVPATMRIRDPAFRFLIVPRVGYVAPRHKPLRTSGLGSRLHQGREGGRRN